jgi:hypothetical protein
MTSIPNLHGHVPAGLRRPAVATLCRPFRPLTWLARVSRPRIAPVR